MNESLEKEELTMQVTTTFNVQDVLDVHDDFSEARAKEFLAKNKAHIEAAMCRAGFQAIEDLEDLEE